MGVRKRGQVGLLTLYARQTAVAGRAHRRVMAARGTLIDASVRFLRTNPELVAYAQSAAQSAGRSVEQLLQDAIDRLRAELDHQALQRAAP